MLGRDVISACSGHGGRYTGEGNPEVDLETGQMWREAGPRTKPRVWLEHLGTVTPEGVVSGEAWASRHSNPFSPHCPASHSQPPKCEAHTRCVSFSMEFSTVPNTKEGRNMRASPRPLGSLGTSGQEIPAGLQELLMTQE